MEPADSIITKLGGPSAVAGIVGIHRTRVSNWKRPKESGGTGGRIPQGYHRALLDYALKMSVALTADEFLTPCQGSQAETQQSDKNTIGAAAATQSAGALLRGQR